MEVKKNALCIDISLLDEKQLRKLTSQANQKLNEIAAEKQRKEKLKENYALKTPEPEFTENIYFMWKSVCGKVANGIEITQEVIDQIKNQNTDKKPSKKREVYTCPECGKMSLFVGVYERKRHEIRKVACESCHFSCPSGSIYDNEREAWELFHEWLIKNKYLPSGTKFPD